MAARMEPAIILVRPQMGENIGAAARAMLNFGLTEMRLVDPRDGWPNPRAVAMASGAAGQVLDRARVFPTLAEAMADVDFAYATTARGRELTKPVHTPATAMAEARGMTAAGRRVALIFGPERAGLENDDVARANAIVTVPVNPDFPSLNLAQAVMVLAYEWWTAAEATPQRQLMTNETHVASKEELEGFLGRLTSELDACGFLSNAQKRPGMIRNLRHLFQRGEVTEQELRTLHGVVSELSRGRMKRGRPEEDEEPG
mgnify:CR=1 FL=1